MSIAFVVDEHVCDLVPLDGAVDRGGIGVPIAGAFRRRHLEPPATGVPEDLARMT
jgi:hypothetical protein